MPHFDSYEEGVYFGNMNDISNSAVHKHTVQIGRLQFIEVYQYLPNC